MSDDEILGMAYENLDVIARIEQPMIFEMSPAELLIFARAIEQRTLTNQKARWYQEGVEAERHDIAKMVENYCGAWDDQGQALVQMIRARGE
jgi:hypothetical protein